MYINNHEYKFINFTSLSEELKKTVLDWRNDESIRKWMYNTDSIHLNDHLKFIASLKDRDDKLYFLVQRDEDYIGVFSIIDFDGKSGEWGYYLAPDFHHRNLGVEFYYAILQFLFEELKIDNLKGYAMLSNQAANSLNTLFGFEKGDVVQKGSAEMYYTLLLKKETWFNNLKINNRIQKLLLLTKN